MDEQNDSIALPEGETMPLHELVYEFTRLRKWCAVCLGEDVAMRGGREV